jgi:hypothetical protein
MNKAEKTSPNRSVSASPPVGGSGFRVARSFRYAPFPRHTPPTFYQPWSLLRKALIRAGKTSPTAETLCDIGAKIYWKFYGIFEKLLTQITIMG